MRPGFFSSAPSGALGKASTVTEFLAELANTARGRLVSRMRHIRGFQRWTIRSGKMNDLISPERWLQ